MSPTSSGTCWTTATPSPDHPAVTGPHRPRGGGLRQRAGGAIHARDGRRIRRCVGRCPRRSRAIERSDDDHYIIYTGGTTGLPKGVVWRQVDAFCACIGGGDPCACSASSSAPTSFPGASPSTRSVPAPGADDARSCAVDLARMAVLGQQGGAHAGIPRPRGRPAARRPRAGQRAHGRRARPSPHICSMPGTGRAATTSRRCSRSPNGGAPMSPSTRERVFTPPPALSRGTWLTGSARRRPVPRCRCGCRPGFGLRATPRPGPRGGRSPDDRGPRRRPRGEPGFGVVGHVLAGGHLPLGDHNDADKTAATLV